ncbi:MAG: tetratricopeptide repeat protein [Chloroherpetonaceae bacterium]|nr:tetratricopeptide repeat protein [Chloroherpetonaceae bacterium]
MRYFLALVCCAAAVWAEKAFAQVEGFSNALPPSSLLISDREFLNDLLAKDRYLALAYENLEILSKDFSQSPPTIERLRAIRIEGFGHLEGEQGEFHNFPTKAEYERFYQFARYQAVRNELNAYRKSLLAAAPRSTLEKALRLDLKSAMLRYEKGDYMTARLYFEDIYETYSPYFRNLDDVLFLQAESNFAIKAFVEAKKLYEQLLVEYPASQYALNAVQRILFVSYVYDDYKQFQRDFRKYKPYIKLEQEADFKVYLLAGTMEYRNQQYARAIEDFAQIPDRSEWKPMADFAAGLAHLALEETKEAERKFRRIIEHPYLPWDTKLSGIRNAAAIQLAHLHYKRGCRFLDEARRFYTGDEKERAKADSTLQAELRTQPAEQQLAAYQRQLIEILKKIEIQDTAVLALARRLESELSAVSTSEQELRQFNEALKENVQNIEAAQEGIDRIRLELAAAQEEGRLAAEQIARMREKLAKAQQEVLFQRFNAYRNFALAEFALAERYFNEVSRGNPDRDLAELGVLWVKFKSGQYREAKREIESYFRKFRTSENLYQAMFLAGYITQAKYPEDPRYALKDYNFVYNGWTGLQYIEKFLAKKAILRQQMLVAQTVGSASENPSEVSAATEISNDIAKAIELLKFDRRAIVGSETGLVADERRPALEELAGKLSAATGAGNNTLREAASSASRAIKEILELATQSVSNDTRLFLTHAPLLVSSELADYRKNLEFYKKVAREEIARSEELIARLQPSAIRAGDPRQQLLSSYYLNNAKSVRTLASAMLTALQQKEFFGEETVERAGTVAQYAFSALTYDEVKKRREQVKSFERVVNMLKSSIRKKINQLELFLEQVKKEEEGTAVVVVTKADLLQKEFEEVLSDFRRAFFIGTDYLLLNRQGEQKKVLLP